MSALQSVFGLPDFRRLFAGVTTSQLGDQFALIATPWLVLQLTGDPLALGLALALEGAPRALFMLVGGAITDRYSPRLLMLVTDLIRFGLAGLMAIAILTGQVEMWMVYLFALGMGLVAGFAVPAGNSIVPMVVAEEDLQAGNATIMGGAQAVGFIGPMIAGILIGTLTKGLDGVGIAFLVDSLTFAFSGLMLWQMRSHQPDPSTKIGEDDALFSSIRAGLKYVWERPTLRLALLIIATINLLFVGPLMVGVPILAEQRLAEGATAFGLLMSGFAGGNLAGYVLAGTMVKPHHTVFRWILVVLLIGFSVTLVVLGFSASTWIDLVALLMLGIGNGYVTIVLISAIQATTPKRFLGRVMGLFMFSSMGLVPVSQAVAGAISRWDVTSLFALASFSMAVVTVWVALQPALATLSNGVPDQDNLPVDRGSRPAGSNEAKLM